MAKAATAEHMSGTESAAMEYSAAAAKAAAVEDRAATTDATASAGVETTAASAANMATASASASAATMPAADFRHQPVRGGFRCRRRARIDQRQRFCALDSCRRQHQHRGSRKAQATDEAAPGIWNLGHV
jgi:hypothetical protein